MSSPPPTATSGRAWWCGRAKCSSQSKSSANAWKKWKAARSQLELKDELPVGRMGLSSVEAPRGECHHFVITGENNRPRRWRVRAPTYQNLQGVPAMIKDQQLADMTISLGSIDPCFSCTDRLETIDLKSGAVKIWSPRGTA